MYMATAQRPPPAPPRSSRHVATQPAAVAACVAGSSRAPERAQVPRIACPIAARRAGPTTSSDPTSTLKAPASAQPPGHQQRRYAPPPQVTGTPPAPKAQAPGRGDRTMQHHTPHHTTQGCATPHHIHNRQRRAPARRTTTALRRAAPQCTMQPQHPCPSPASPRQATPQDATPTTPHYTAPGHNLPHRNIPRCAAPHHTAQHRTTLPGPRHSTSHHPAQRHATLHRRNAASPKRHSLCSERLLQTHPADITSSRCSRNCRRFRGSRRLRAITAQTSSEPVCLGSSAMDALHVTSSNMTGATAAETLPCENLDTRAPSDISPQTDQCARTRAAPEGGQRTNPTRRPPSTASAPIENNATQSHAITEIRIANHV